jgi:D-serine deaminase-like pyridoxal phosphate-dependent protein
MLVSDLDTPAAVVDLDAMEDNIRRLAEYCKEHGLSQRPHTKTHKTPAIAHKQVDAGAVGITVAKVGEAEVMAAGGLKDIFIAYPVIGDIKQERLARLANQVTITAACDSREGIEGLSQHAREENSTIKILVDVDSGLHRTGVASVEDAVELAKLVEQLPNLEFEGIMVYPGHLWHDLEHWKEIALAEGPLIQKVLKALRAEGLEARTVSSGGTASAYMCHLVEGLTEVRSGTYVFNDLMGVGIGEVAMEQCALNVVVTVASSPEPGRVIVDGGSKTFSSDRDGSGKFPGFGQIREYPGVYIEWMNEEHGVLNVEATDHRFKVGERLTVVPNHACVVTNLHPEIVGVRKGRVETIWEVQGRGKLK